MNAQAHYKPYKRRYMSVDWNAKPPFKNVKKENFDKLCKSRGLYHGI